MRHSTAMFLFVLLVLGCAADGPGPGTEQPPQSCASLGYECGEDDRGFSCGNCQGTQWCNTLVGRCETCSGCGSRTCGEVCPGVSCGTCPSGQSCSLYGHCR